MFKYLKIAVSVLCLIACVSMISLWMRSNRYADFLGWELPGSQRFTINSEVARLHFAWREKGKEAMARGIRSHKIDPKHVALMQQMFSRKEIALGFAIRRDPATSGVTLPHWYLVLIFAALAAAPWVKWSRRFSLRALLISMTLIAVLLGIFAISSHYCPANAGTIFANLNIFNELR